MDWSPTPADKRKVELTARSFWSMFYDLDWDDVTQIGWELLLKARSTWDETQGSWENWRHFILRQGYPREVENYRRTNLGQPRIAQHLHRRISQELRELRLKGRPVTLKEACSRAGIDLEYYRRHILSYYVPRNSDGVGDPEEYWDPYQGLASENEPDPVKSQIFQKFFESLADQDREAFRLYLEGHSGAEVSRRMGKTRAWFDALWNRSVNRFLLENRMLEGCWRHPASPSKGSSRLCKECQDALGRAIRAYRQGKKTTDWFRYQLVPDHILNSCGPGRTYATLRKTEQEDP
jgi:DNA-directed RNA polymerase specialized sigma subunit